MTTLRVLLSGPDAIDGDLRWAHYDADECIATGYASARHWPDADALEIVIAASQVRLASVALPPIPPARVAAAAAFALEDQLAGPSADQLLAASRQRADGRVVVVVVARSLLRALQAQAARSSLFENLTRVAAEPDLAQPGTGWCWCVPDDIACGDGFVRLAEGSAFPLDRAQRDGALPPQLELALAAAKRNGAMPAQIRVDAAVADESLMRWHRETGVVFVRGAPWRWHAGAPAAFDGATNLLQGEFASTAQPPSGSRTRSFGPALWIIGGALAIHVAASLGEWTWWRIDAWRTSRAWTALALANGIPAADAANNAAARTAIAHRYSEARHANGLPAPNDALPLLARAAPALMSIPPSILKSATYADDHWTLDLQKTDPAVVRELDAQLKRAGTPAISATTAAGTRLRFGSF